MVIDSSALLAILLNEDEAARLARAIALDDVRMASAATILEAAFVVESSRRDIGAVSLDSILHDLRVSVVPFTEAQLAIARRAFRRYGKGRHPAGLNFGDCFAYALAKDVGEPLLFKGKDFAQTDITAVQY